MFGCAIMMRFHETKVAKKKNFIMQKKSLRGWCWQYGKEKQELWVASYEFRHTSYELKSMS